MFTASTTFIGEFLYMVFLCDRLPLWLLFQLTVLFCMTCFISMQSLGALKILQSDKLCMYVVCTEFFICYRLPPHPYSGITCQALSNELCCTENLPQRYECSGSLHKFESTPPTTINVVILTFGTHVVRSTVSPHIHAACRNQHIYRSLIIK